MSHHDKNVSDNNCQFCTKIYCKNIKEKALHSLWQSEKVKNLYSKVAIELGVDKYTTFPLTAKQVIIWDEGKNESSPINLLIAIWTITVNEILGSRSNDTPMDHLKVAKLVKGEIISSVRAFSRKKISTEVRRLGLLEFMASKSFNSI